jgi:hypothetical protein
MVFKATAWNNGHFHPSGAGYGIKISFENRNNFFNRDWQTVILHLKDYNNPIEVNVAKSSFWSRKCGELISQDIGLWLQLNNSALWPRNQPLRVKISVLKDREFNVELI